VVFGGTICLAPEKTPANTNQNRLSAKPNPTRAKKRGERIAKPARNNDEAGSMQWRAKGAIARVLGRNDSIEVREERATGRL
jgi:hypothetical protein